MSSHFHGYCYWHRKLRINSVHVMWMWVEIQFIPSVFVLYDFVPSRIILQLQLELELGFSVYFWAVFPGIFQSPGKEKGNKSICVVFTWRKARREGEKDGLNWIQVEINTSQEVLKGLGVSWEAPWRKLGRGMGMHFSWEKLQWHVSSSSSPSQ